MENALLPMVPKVAAHPISVGHHHVEANTRGNDEAQMLRKR